MTGPSVLALRENGQCARDERRCSGREGFIDASIREAGNETRPQKILRQDSREYVITVMYSEPVVAIRI